MIASVVGALAGSIAGPVSLPKPVTVWRPVWTAAVAGGVLSAIIGVGGSGAVAVGMAFVKDLRPIGKFLGD